MKVSLKRSFLISIFILMLAMLVACGNNNDKNPDNAGVVNGGNNEPDNIEENVADKDPITLTFAVNWDDDMFNERLKNPIEEKFPYITLEKYHVDNFSRDDLEEMFGSGMNPDFFFTLSYSDIEYFRIDQDLTPLIEKYGVSTDKISSSIIDGLQATDEEGRLLSWPYEDTYYVVMYNKEIFDLFGVEYPDNDFTWEELIQYAKQMTVEREGVQYQGLDFREDIPFSQLSINKTDPETGEVQLINNDAIIKYIDMYQQFFDTLPADFEGDIFTDQRFFNGTTAMLVTNAQAVEWAQSVYENAIDYDLAAIPTWEGLEDRAPRGFLHTLTLSPDSEYEEDIIKIFEYLSSDEYQEWMARHGLGIVTANEDLQNLFFADLETTEGKNIPAIFKNEVAPPPEKISIWDQYVSIDLQSLYESKLDTNEFLRITTEESEIKINEAKEIE